MKNKLYLYLQENFKENEPFFYKDINFSSSIDSIRHQISRFVKEGKLCKYNNGTFFIPKNSLLGLPSVISSEKVAASKYIKHNDEIIGYYSGHTFANQIGVSLQVPMVKEIISNKCSAIVRTVKLNKKNFQIRKPKVIINNDNYLTLQILSLLENYEKFVDLEVNDAKQIIEKYIQKNNIKKNDLLRYADNFNSRVYKYISILEF